LDPFVTEVIVRAALDSDSSERIVNTMSSTLKEVGKFFAFAIGASIAFSLIRPQVRFL
jgi:hypothetical protein